MIKKENKDKHQEKNFLLKLGFVYSTNKRKKQFILSRQQVKYIIDEATFLCEKLIECERKKNEK